MATELDLLSENLLFTVKEKRKLEMKSLYIIDFGFIKAVSDDKSKVNVEHVSIPVSYNPKEGSNSTVYNQDQSTLTSDVELIFLGSSLFKIQWDVQIGDIVLLLGVRSKIDTIQGKTQSIRTQNPGMGYEQESMKALPLASKVNAQINIVLSVDNTKIKIDAGTKDAEILAQNIKLGSDTAASPFVKGDALFSQLNTILVALQTFTSGLTTVTLAGQATAMNTACGTAIGILNQIKSIKIMGE
jgi:hypothetical protein